MWGTIYTVDSIVDLIMSNFCMTRSFSDLERLVCFTGLLSVDRFVDLIKFAIENLFHKEELSIVKFRNRKALIDVSP